MAVEHLQGGVKVGRFVVVRMIREDDAGVTYLGEYRTRIGQLNHCIIREFFPAGFAKRDGTAVVQPSDPEKKKKFQRGYQHFADVYTTMARIQDDSIAPLIDLVEENGTRYMVSEYTSDESIGDLIAGSGNLRDTFVLSFLSMFLPAMDILEELGVVNTRLSPDNIHRRVDGIPVLTHFAESIVDDVTVVEPEEGLQDTPYLAPEVGEDGVDHRADIYSLGAIALHALTGKTPISALTRLRQIEASQPDPMNVRTWLRGATDNEALVASLEASLSLTPAMRPSGFEAWRTMLFRPTNGTARLGATVSNWFSSPVARFAAIGLVGLLFIGVIAVLLPADRTSNRDASADRDVSTPNETLASTDTTIVDPEPDSDADTVAVDPAPTETERADVAVTTDPDIDPETLERNQNARREWLAINRDDPALVGAFLNTYADTEIGEAATIRFDTLDNALWTAASEQETVDAYEGYLVDFGPDATRSGAFADDAEARIAELTAEQLALEAAVRSGLIGLGYEVDADATPLDADFRNAVRAFKRFADLPVNDDLNDDLIAALSRVEAERTAERAADARRDAERDARLAAEAEAAAETVDREMRVASVETQTELVEQATRETVRTPDPERQLSADDVETLVTPPQDEARQPVETVTITRTRPTGTQPTTTVPTTSERTIQTGTAPVTTEPEVSVEPEPEAQTPPPAEPNVGDIFSDCAACPEMKVLASGRFRMGSRKSEPGRSDNEGPLRDVSIAAPIAISLHEVTVGSFNAFLSATGHTPASSCFKESPAGSGEWKAQSGAGPRNPGFEQTASHPVSCVRHQDAVAFADWLSRETGATYRLPTEAEWEYAARAGSQSARPWRGRDDLLCRHANGADATAEAARSTWLTHTCDDGELYTAAVGSYRANGFGLYDMIGNVWEWVEDCYAPNLESVARDGSATSFDGCANRVIRGGSWASSDVQLRSAKRSGDRSDRAYDILGFRVVREIRSE